MNEKGILIVDDELDAINALKSILVDKGYKRIYTATSGIEAISLLAEKGEEIYIVMLDIQMPQMTGFEIISHISQVHKYHVAVIMATAYDGFVNQFVNMNVSLRVDKCGYLIKPYSLQEFEDIIENAITRIENKRKDQIEKLNQLITNKLDVIHSDSSLINNKLDNIISSNKGLNNFLKDIGVDILKLIIIGLAVIAFLYLGFSDLIKQIIEK